MPGRCCLGSRCGRSTDARSYLSKWTLDRIWTEVSEFEEFTGLDRGIPTSREVDISHQGSSLTHKRLSIVKPADQCVTRTMLLVPDGLRLHLGPIVSIFWYTKALQFSNE